MSPYRTGDVQLIADAPHAVVDWSQYDPTWADTTIDWLEQRW